MVDSRRTRRPDRISGASAAGTTSSSARVSHGLTKAIIARAPSMTRPLRSATEVLTPTMVSTMAVSVVRRDSTSPVRVLRK